MTLLSARPSASLRLLSIVAAIIATRAAAQVDPSRNSDDMSMMPMRQAMRVPIFFPPYPPALDRPVARSIGAVGRLAAPAELGAFLNESFYPQLSTRLATHSLGEKQKQAVDQYREAKLAVQAQLRAELERLRDAEPAVRRQGLEAFARGQTPKLIALEQTAEKLRQDLGRAGQGWSDLREWHLTDKDRRGFSPVELAQVMRAYAYYEPALAAPQRRLLREVSLELLLAADSTEKAAANNPYVFFQPELSRVAFPADVSADLAARIANFQSKKSQLKKDLFEAVRRHDGAALGFLRNPLRGLADKQAAAIAELETLAEAIRAGLALLAPAPVAVNRSPLPAALTERLTAMLRERDVTQRDATVRVEALLAGAGAAAARVVYRFDDDGLKFVIAPARGRGGRGPETGPIEAVRAAMMEIADDYGSRMAALINERDAIRREAGVVIGSTTTSKIDAALAAANRVAVQKQNEIAYHDYRLAVFEPGLSPEQRRLLFDAAMESLGLPLPRGEMQPTRRGSSW